MTNYEHHNALPQGHRLEEYELVRVLGFGGFGITYLGFDHHLDKGVAIKEYLPSDLATRTTDGSVAPQASKFRGDFQEGLERFLEEARTLARFDHRHIIKVHRYFEAHGTAYIVMEYAEGETLLAYLADKGTLTEAELKKILYPILDGLEVVHRADFLHRDIKPANIVLRDEDDLPVLLDFGAARQAIGAKSRSIAAIVTPGYAPIEQYSERGHQGAWTDIYALGAVCYQALTGQVPTAATDRVQVQDDSLVPVSQRCKSPASRGFLSAIDRALSVYREARPQSIGAWQEMLDPDPVDPAALEKQRQEEQAALEQQQREQAAVERQRREQAAEEARLAAEQAEKQRREQAALDKQRREDQAVLKKAGVYSLHQAASKNAAEAAEVLIRQGAKVNAKDKYGDTPLHKAARENASEAAEVLIKHGADIEAKTNNEFGYTPLHKAASGDASEAAEVLIRQGAKVNAKDKYGWTPLHRAVEKDASEAAEILIKHGADIEAKTNYGHTPLHRAAYDKASEAAEVLIKHGADIEAKTNNEFGYTPLHKAASGDASEAAEVLIRQGAKVNAKDKYGWTPLHRAVEKDASEAAEILIKHGADIEAKTNYGETPLHRAAYDKASEAAEVLIKHGADIQAKNNNGDTPLHKAAWEDATEAIEILIKHGADIQAKNNNGDTPLHELVQQRREQAAVERQRRKQAAVRSLMWPAIVLGVVAAWTSC